MEFKYNKKGAVIEMNELQLWKINCSIYNTIVCKIDYEMIMYIIVHVQKAQHNDLTPVSWYFKMSYFLWCIFMYCVIKRQFSWWCWTIYSWDLNWLSSAADVDDHLHFVCEALLRALCFIKCQSSSLYVHMNNPLTVWTEFTNLQRSRLAFIGDGFGSKSLKERLSSKSYTPALAATWNIIKCILSCN